jgi:hypothetical protein
MSERDSVAMRQGAEIQRLKEALIDILQAATLDEAQRIADEALKEKPLEAGL